MTANRKSQPQKAKVLYNLLLKRIKHITIEQVIYLIFGIYFFATMLDYTVIPEFSPLIDKFFKLVKYSCCLIFLGKAYIDIKRSGKISLSIMIFATLSFLSFIFSHNRNLFLFFCALTGLRKMNTTRLIKIAYYISITLFLLTISLSLLGAIPNWTFARAAITRNALGFIFATDCIGIYLSIILMYFYLRRSDAKIFDVILFEVLNIFLYKATDGRLSFILITILLAILAMDKFLRLAYTRLKNQHASTIAHLKQQIQQKIIPKKHHLQTAIKVICYILPAILFIAFNTLTVAYIHDPHSMRKIDRLFSSRLKYTAQAYENYQIPIFGKDIVWQGWGGYGYADEVNVDNFEYNFVDSSYARLIFDFGIIYTLVILAAYTYCLTYYLKKKDYWSLTIIIFILIWSFIEPFMINITRNPLALLLMPTLELGPSLYLQKKKGKNSRNTPML